MNKLFTIITSLIFTGSFAACGQGQGNNKDIKTQVMDTSKLTNSTVKAAFQAWQQGDSKLWLSFFTDKAQLLDDGHTRNFQKFSTEAIGHERFTSIDKVEDNGLSIYGQFHSDTWGNFKTYFKFHIDSNRKIDKLEIGQADY
jgi:hypothetical protein